MTARKLRVAALSSENPTMQSSPLPAKPTLEDALRQGKETHDCVDQLRGEFQTFREQTTFEFSAAGRARESMALRQDEQGRRQDEQGALLLQIGQRVGAGQPGTIKSGRPGAWIGFGAGIATIIGFLAKASGAWPDIERAASAVLRALGGH
jgi:hypothetical protein